ncbi:MAG: hypothetical protein PWR29_668 [Methanolobus sp.]|nr:hypothetical protein [Methanolobus sp.]MDN5310349.1 hypothetical protein [Methanolobus sp.]
MEAHEYETILTMFSLEANSTERGLAYNVTSYDSDNVTKVMITTNATNFYNLVLEQLR